MTTTTSRYFIEHAERFIGMASRGEEVEIILDNRKSLILKLEEEE